MKNLRNNVRLIGRLGVDPKVTKFENGKQVVSMRIATDESYKNKEGERVENTQWHNLVVWNGLSKVAEKYLKKGMEITVEGRLVHRSYEDKNGKTVFVTEVEVHDLLMMGKKVS
ncbi:MAG: single-stranded DNA-binding protein [Bacteroidetes bacterium]|nr:MAG: single-stranded DNA-binding protein [Bacteroidota bacterium]